MADLNKILSEINLDTMTSDEKNAVLEIADNLLADVCCCLVAKKGEGQPFPFENQMVEELLTTWAAAARVAMDEAIKNLLRREGHPVTDDIYDILNIMQGNMDNLFGPVVKAKVGETLLKSYKRAKKSVFGKYNLKMDWSVVDDTAIDWLQNHHMYWIDTYYSKFVSGKIADVVTEGITEGLGRVEVGNKLKEFFKSYPGVKNKPDVYWRGLAANAMNRSRSFGSIAGYEELEIKEIEILAVMDERTSPICFAPWTPITTTAGIKPISQVSPGESVVTGSGISGRVKAKSCRTSHNWVLIQLSSGNILTVTNEHPILTKGGWRKAKDLKIGDNLAQKRKTNFDMPELRETIRGRVKSREKVLLSQMLSSEQEQGCLGDSNMRSLREGIQDAQILCRTRAKSALQYEMPEYGSSKGIESGPISPNLQSLRQEIQNKTNRISFWQNQTALLDTMSEAPWNNDLCLLRKGIRIQTNREGNPEILFSGMLSQSTMGVITGIIDRRDTQGIWNKIRNGKTDRKLFDRLFSSGVQHSSGSGRRILAFAQQAYGIDKEKRDSDIEGWLCISEIVGRGNERGTGEKTVEEYLCGASGFDTIIGIHNIYLSEGLPAYNLEINNDPTYIANNIIVHNCRAMNGKVFSITQAASQRDKLMAAESPENVKQIAAWPTVAQVQGKSGGQLTAAGIVLPPYHFHCRTTFVERRQTIRREIRQRYKPAA